MKLWIRRTWCRGFGHREITTYVLEGDKTFVPVAVVCSRCGTHTWQVAE